MSLRREERLAGVHPDLVRVVKRAAVLLPIDFMVVEGVRSRDQAAINYGKGRTIAECLAKGVPAKCAAPRLGKVTWLNNPFATQHSIKADGFGHAVDLLPAPFDWKDVGPFDRLADAMVAAAKELGVPIRCGCDWDCDGKRHERGETDSPHYELVP